MAQLKDGTRVYGTLTANTEVVIGTMNVSTTLTAGYGVTNAAFGVANAAFLVANTALPNTSGALFNGDLYFPYNSTLYAPYLLHPDTANSSAYLDLSGAGTLYAEDVRAPLQVQTNYISGWQLYEPLKIAQWSANVSVITNIAFEVKTSGGHRYAYISNTGSFLTAPLSIGRVDQSHELDVVGTVNASSIMVNNVDLPSSINTYTSILVANNAVGANAWANTVGVAGNNYTDHVGLSTNTYSSILAANNAVGANNWANTVGIAGNNYTDSVGAAANAYMLTVSTDSNNYTSVLVANNAVGSNNWANTVGAAGNNYTDSVGAAGNNYTNFVGASGNSYAEHVGAAGNNWATATFATLSNVAFTYDTLNTAFGVSNSSFIHANAGYDTVNASYGSSNANWEVQNNLYSIANVIFHTVNLAYNTANSGGADLGPANTWSNGVGMSANSYAGYMANSANAFTVNVYESANSNWVVTNTAYQVANSAFDAANNVGPQIAPTYNTANAAFLHANTAYDSANSNWTVQNLVYATANAAFDAANNVGPQIAPTYNTANAAFIHANAAYTSVNSVAIAANSYADYVGTSANSYVTNNFYKLDANGMFASDITLRGGQFGGTYIVFMDSKNSYANSVQMAVEGQDQLSLYWGPGHQYQAYFMIDGTTSFTSPRFNIAGQNVLSTIYTGDASSNSYTNYVGTSANSYSQQVGAAGNNYTNYVGASANSYANYVGASANAKASATYVTSVSGTSGRVTSSGGLTPTIDLATAGAGAATYSSGISALTVDAYGRLTSVTGSANYITNSISTNFTTTARFIGGALQFDSYGNWTGGAAGGAAICNDNGSYQALMIVGNSSAGGSRLVKVWDNLIVNGSIVSPAISSPTISGTVNIQAAIANYTLTDGANIAWDLNTGQVATVTLGGSRTMNAPSNLRVGTFILHVIQDGTGSRTLTWNSVFKWPAGIAPVLTTAANRRDIFSFICDGTNLYGSYLPDVR